MDHPNTEWQWKKRPQIMVMMIRMMNDDTRFYKCLSRYLTLFHDSNLTNCHKARKFTILQLHIKSLDFHQMLKNECNTQNSRAQPG